MLAPRSRLRRGDEHEDERCLTDDDCPADANEHVRLRRSVNHERRGLFARRDTRAVPLGPHDQVVARYAGVDEHQIGVEGSPDDPRGVLNEHLRSGVFAVGDDEVEPAAIHATRSRARAVKKHAQEQGERRPLLSPRLGLVVGRKVVGPVALGLVVALAPSCRQLAGIHVVESQQAACSTCVDASCGPQSSTCLATASCATRLECALACNPTDGTCVPGCQAQPVGDADDLGAVEACIAKSCGSACELTWGGILPPVPPSAASACQACISAQCSAADQACAQSADCSTGVECARSHSTPDTLQTCELGNPAAAPLYSALASCVEASCPRRARSGPTGRASVRSRGRSLRPTPWSAR